ncbi:MULTISPECIES: ABC transporter permease [Legionella]|uniref:ABC transporter permease n=1 Tax=Legionella resiliens TaxID=2905958 RepID=A0ABS8X5D6_9GAMM|nr:MULTISPECIES: ABC transporter permease [unclassified Legionella]MCE0724826.1 ABC transporter permease [Legionella sp. 9fVS26]MCE3533980.1 ABC transporter permease [Legionella sp. 8cVS16]QLZ70215.1 ABC transporter permease [Legionella sp. PC1000]
MIKMELWRVFSVAKKEFIQIKRNSPTFLLLFLIPVMQILLFGFMINTNPKYLPTAVISSEENSFTRTLLEGLKHTDYFSLKFIAASEKAADKLLLSGKGLFVVNIPPNFSRDLIRGKKPHVLIEADASDPISISNAFRAASELPSKVFERELRGSLDYLVSKGPPFAFDIHAKFNPEGISQYNIVPGLISVLIFTTLTLLTAMSITSEYEIGTFETLLITPLSATNIIFGKVIPHFIAGYFILFVLLMISSFVFAVPFYGSIPLYLFIMAFYAISNLSLGLVISAFAKTQFQAVAAISGCILVAVMTSGFLFPFSGMPIWAQYIGQILPLTHFIRITRNIMLKGADFNILWPDVLPIILFTLFIVILGTLIFRKTLD